MSGIGGGAGRGDESTVGVSSGRVGSGAGGVSTEGTVGVGVSDPPDDGGLEEPEGCAVWDPARDGGGDASGPKDGVGENDVSAPGCAALVC